MQPGRARDVDLLRRFNRVYTQRLGFLNEHLDGSPFSLAEARVLYEIAHRPGVTAAEISRVLGLDRAQLSRILAALKKGRLVNSAVSPKHAKHRLLTLTSNGRKAFDELNEATNRAVAKLLSGFEPDHRRMLVDASKQIVDVLEPDVAGEPALRLRDPAPGDIGWVVHRQAVLYAAEYGWDWTYEALICQILGDFVQRFDPARDKAWIAELDSSVAGSVFLKAGDGAAGVAKLRLLYVEPWARGRGIGSTLVDACIDQAREFGYRRLELWTNSVLTSARRIYEAAGFTLVEETRHTSFGQDLLGQVWAMELQR